MTTLMSCGGRSSINSDNRETSKIAGIHESKAHRISLFSDWNDLKNTRIFRLPFLDQCGKILAFKPRMKVWLFCCCRCCSYLFVFVNII